MKTIPGYDAMQTTSNQIGGGFWSLIIIYDFLTLGLGPLTYVPLYCK